MWKVPEIRASLSVFAVVMLVGATLPVWAEAPVTGRTEVSGDSKTVAAGLPRIQFTSMEHDFGQANSGEDLKTTFSFKNVGDGVLVIQNVKGG